MALGPGPPNDSRRRTESSGLRTDRASTEISGAISCNVFSSRSSSVMFRSLQPMTTLPTISWASRNGVPVEAR